jgi:hypothetical protein
MSPWLQLLLFGCWISIGLLIGRWHRRTGTAILWVVVLGPVGLLLVSYGEWRRSRAGTSEAEIAPVAENLNLPVEVSVEGQWYAGRLQAWTQREGTWQGWVEYQINSKAQAAWFGEESIRKVPSGTA